MNHMRDVAKMLGVELEEEFKLKANGIVSKHNFRLTKHGLFIDDRDCKTPFSETLNDILTDLYDVVKLHEFPEPILDDTEKECLAGVIKPFRNEVKSIKKDSDELGPYILIALHSKPATIIPIKDPEISYIGMEPGKDYLPEELSL